MKLKEKKKTYVLTELSRYAAVTLTNCCYRHSHIQKRKESIMKLKEKKKHTC